MLLTQCAVCATDLGLSSGKKCGRCTTRYCGPACQKKHWEEGGHDQLCKKIKKAGGAEQFHANTKYTEAVAVAAEACADDTRGQTCYICLQAVHSRTGEGLVRGCACGDRDGVASGTTGIAHVSCLAEQAKILFAEAEENNLLNKAEERFQRWSTCSLCEQQYHGVVRCALGWACWKTYMGRPATDDIRTSAMTQLGIGLSSADHHEDALTVREAELSTILRIGAPLEMILVTQNNLAATYARLGRDEDALRMSRDVYSGHMKLDGEEHKGTLTAALNYAAALVFLKRFEEAKSLLRKTLPVARRVLGESNEFTLKMRNNYAEALYEDASATLDDLREAVTTLEELERTARRVMGGAHPLTVGIEGYLRDARAALRAREAPAPGGT